MTIRAVDMIAKERSAQINYHGYEREFDRGQARFLIEMSAKYLKMGAINVQIMDEFDVNHIVMDEEVRKKSLKQLVRSGALIAAAIDSILLEGDDE